MSISVTPSLITATDASMPRPVMTGVSTITHTAQTTSAVARLTSNTLSSVLILIRVRSLPLSWM